MSAVFRPSALTKNLALTLAILIFFKSRHSKFIIFHAKKFGIWEGFYV